MVYTSVSTKYQVVIPKEVRSRVAIKPGQRLMIYEKNGMFCLIPEVPLKKLKGTLKSFASKTPFQREKKDRL